MSVRTIIRAGGSFDADRNMNGSISSSVSADARAGVNAVVSTAGCASVGVTTRLMV